ncbi:ABC transporter ATP-binding protein [Crocinitomicaceae bacterium]|nr:ABC transporter ATP-binding protein [Crocinitomicaceae bacterium]
MEREVLVKVEGVSKKFAKDLKKSLLYGLADVFRSVFKSNKEVSLRKDEFWAIQDVSFELRRGECIGLIGHNGAGKSTLLKMLNGLISPDIGRIEMKGKVGALIELGAGFNPILTGRENIYNNAAVLGFSKKEINEKFDEIVAFAEIGEYLDMPVKNYSSGMRVRLGFAVAAQMQPDILLVDEVLAVGDMGFVLKCFNQMDKLLNNTAIILVSHSMPQVSRMATQILMLEKGKVEFYSDNVADGLTNYYKRHKLEIPDYKGSDKAEFKKWKIITENQSFELGDEVVINYNDKIRLELEIECFEKLANPSIYIAIYDNEQRNIAEIYNFNDKVQLENVFGNFISAVEIQHLNLSQGKYSITIALICKEDKADHTVFRYQSAIYFTVHGETHGWAPFQLDADWSLMN